MNSVGKRGFGLVLLGLLLTIILHAVAVEGQTTENFRPGGIAPYTVLQNPVLTFWVRGTPLATCINNASNPGDGSAPFPVPQWAHKGFFISGNDFLGPYRYWFTNLPWISPIYVVGHSGLTRHGVDGSQDAFYHNPSDHP